MKIWIINGANLNFLGKRDIIQYGERSYETLCDMIREKAQEISAQVQICQSNHEGELIDKLQEAYQSKVDALIINPGAFAHYSYALRDALEVLDCIKIEVHISNIQKREEFRRKSLTAEVCDAVMSGFGLEGYLLAMDYLILLCGGEKNEVQKKEQKV